MDCIKTFFKDLFGDKHINFNSKPYSGGFAIPTNGYFNKNTIDKLEQLNEQDREIYFVVNSGGYKGEEINEINSVFIDLDYGKDAKGKYYPLQDVEIYKQDKLQEVNNFLEPSYVVETRNGLHVYWLVNEGATTEQYLDCQKRLIQQFKADKQCFNLNRPMRVPGFYWCKDKNNKFLAKIIQRNEVRYDITSIIDNLPELINEDKGTYNKKKYYNTLLLIDGTSIPTNNNNIGAIKNQDVSRLQEFIQPVPIEFSNHDDVYDYLKRQDLHKFLGVSGRYFKCLFHDDSNPSAGIIVNQNTKHQIYNCQSERCGFKGTIIQATERILHCSTPEALRFLRKVYKVGYYETEWQKLQKEIYVENQRFIYSTDFEEFYTPLYRMVNNYLHELSILNMEAKERIITENFTDREGNPVFFISIRHLADKYKKDAKTLCIRLGIFAYLGLINKLDDSEIPPDFLKRAKQEAATKGYGNRINFYSIPSYCYHTLIKAQGKAIEFRQRGYTVKVFSREMILRCEGEREANRVFPQMEGQGIPQLNSKVAKDIENSLMSIILDKQWATSKEVLINIISCYGWRRSKVERQLKITLPELYDKYCLKRIKAGKIHKEQFGIIHKGYPYIIISENQNLGGIA